MKQKFNVTGMTCSACSAHVTKAVEKLPGVSSVNVNLLGGSMLVEYDPGAESPESIIAAVDDAGYGAALPASKGGAKADAAPAVDMEAELLGMKRRFVISLCFLLPLFYIAMGHMMGWPLPHFFHDSRNALSFALIQFLLVLPIMYVNDKYYKVGFKTLLHGSPNMDSLIALGSLAAVVYGVAALFQISYGMGHGDAERVSKWSMDLYFESAAMSLSSVSVVSNALRLKLFKPRRSHPAESVPTGADGHIDMKQEVCQMDKKLTIDGMMCQHCVAHVSKALNSLPGVTASVDLDTKTATVSGTASDEALKKAVEEAGYSVVSIS